MIDVSAPLVQYGSLGVFCLYLIYDRQVLLKKLMETIEKNTESTNLLIDELNALRRRSR